MTRARVVALINSANALLKAQDCVGARQALGQAWLALGDYSAELARKGVSPSAALAVHKTLSKALVAAGRRCGVADPNELMQPSWQRSTRTNPDLIAPSFAGVGDEIYDRVTTTLSTLGIAAAIFGISYGFYRIYKSIE